VPLWRLMTFHWGSALRVLTYTALQICQQHS